MLIYTPGKTDQPVRFDGPVSEKEIPLSGPVVYAQLVGGASNFKIEGLGYTDDI